MHWCLTPVILATREAEIRRITVRSQPAQTVCDTLSRKTPITKNWAGGMVQGPELHTHTHTKKKINVWKHQTWFSFSQTVYPVKETNISKITPPFQKKTVTKKWHQNPYTMNKPLKNKTKLSTRAASSDHIAGHKSLVAKWNYSAGGM
jgi:hypothetical protein